MTACCSGINNIEIIYSTQCLKLNSCQIYVSLQQVFDNLLAFTRSKELSMNKCLVYLGNKKGNIVHEYTVEYTQEITNPNYDNII